jgi:hypothetical protein
MTDKSIIQTYINNFRRYLAPYLKPGIGLHCTVHPSHAGGAVLEFRMGAQVENDDAYVLPVETLGRALSSIPQQAFGGNLDGFRFSGTNYVLESDRVILIKDDSPAAWSDGAAAHDVARVVTRRSHAP